MRIVSIGEVLWDVIGGTEHFGGAPMNFAAHCRQLGHEVRFISRVGTDERGELALERMKEIGVDARYVNRSEELSTGVVTVKIENGQPQFTIHRPAAYDNTHMEPAQLAEIKQWKPDWIYFGTLAQTSETMKTTLRMLLDAAPDASRFYDVNLRAESYTIPLLFELLQSAQIVKLNDVEVAEVSTSANLERSAGFEDFCRTLAAKFDLRAVCVTRGLAGCSLLVGDGYVEHPAFAVDVADTVGAGDAFAAALVHGLGEGWEPMRIAEFCNRVGALVASRPGAIPLWRLEELETLKSSKTWLQDI